MVLERREVYGSRSGHCAQMAGGLVTMGTSSSCLRELRLMKQVSGADFAMKEYGPSPDAAERIASEATNETAT